MDRSSVSAAPDGLMTVAWRWGVATYNDPNRIAWLYIPVLAYLPLTLGSVATFFFFGACIYVGLLFFSGRVGWVWPPTTAFGCIASLVFFASTILSPLLFPNKLAGWMDVGTAAHYAALLFLVGTLIQTPKVDAFDLFLNGLRVACIVSFAYAAIEVFVLGHPRATAGMANAIPYGDTAVLSAGLAMVGFSRLGTRMRWIAVAAFLCGIGGAFLSQTRGALLALPLVGIVLILHLWPLIRARLWQAGLAAIAAVGTLGVLAVVMHLPQRVDEVRQALHSETLGQDRDVSTAHRVYLWTYGVAAFREAPVLGYGSQNAVTEVRARAARDGIVLPPYRHLHNEFLSIGVGRGLLGLAAMLLLLAAPIIIAFRSARDERFRDRRAFAVLLSGCYALFGLTNLLFSHDQTNTVFASCYLVLLVAAHQSLVGLTRFSRPFLGVSPSPGRPH